MEANLNLHDINTRMAIATTAVMIKDNNDITILSTVIIIGEKWHSSWVEDWRDLLDLIMTRSLWEVWSSKCMVRLRCEPQKQQQNYCVVSWKNRKEEVQKRWCIGWIHIACDFHIIIMILRIFDFLVGFFIMIWVGMTCFDASSASTIDQ